WLHLPGPNSADPWAEGLVGPGQAWSDVRVTALGNNRYALTFAREQDGDVELRRVEAQPLFEARSEAQAEALYQEMWQRYRQRVTGWQADSVARLSRRAEIAAAQVRYQAALAVWEAQRAAWAAQGGSLRYHLRTSQLGVVGFLESQLAWPEATRAFALPDSLRAGRAWLVWPGRDAIYPQSLVDNHLQLPVDPVVVWVQGLAGGWWRGSLSPEAVSWTRLAEPIDQAILWQSLAELAIDL
ncbi:MAG: hypothetical protein D6722_08005, partial [Bacteroidetes bacterium]